MAEKVWDVIMVGAGPASLSAAIYTTREDLKTVLFEKGAVGGLAAVTDWIDNYPGFPKGIAGLEFADSLWAQAERFGAELELGEVSEIIDEGKIKRLKTTSGDFLAKAVLIGTGSDYKKIGVPGEKEFYALNIIGARSSWVAMGLLAEVFFLGVLGIGTGVLLGYAITGLFHVYPISLLLFTGGQPLLVGGVAIIPTVRLWFSHQYAWQVPLLVSFFLSLSLVWPLYRVVQRSRRAD